MTDETRDAIEKAKKSFAELLLTDIDTAMISLDVSDVTQNTETRDSERRTALRAFEAIGRLVDSDRVTPEDGERITTALKPLANRLAAMGMIRVEV